MAIKRTRSKVRNIALQAGVTGVILAVMAAAAVIVPGPVVDIMLKQDLQVQAENWRDRIVSHLDQRERSFELRAVSQLDQEFLNGVVQASDIFRLRLLSPDGLVFWASIPEEIGIIHNPDEHGDELSADKILVTIDGARAHEYEASATGGAVKAADAHDDDEHGGDEMIAEIDAPVTVTGGFGRVEMFVDLTEQRTIFISRVRVVIGMVAAIAALAGGVLMVAVLRGNRRRMVDQRERSDEERTMLSDQLRMAREVRLLGELNEWLQSSRSLDELFDMVARFLTYILPDCEGSMYVYSNSRDVLDGCSSWNGGTHKAHIHPEECWGLRRGRTYVFGESDVDFTCAHAEPHDGRSYLCIPVLAHGETIGLMHLRAREGRSMQDFKDGRRLAQMCAEQISLAIANVRMRDQLQDQSIRDPLTGLYNRRHLTDTLRRALSARQRNNTDLAIIAIDVDHFKKFNDNHGHDAGDMVLRAVGGALSQLCDREEVACRIGGEELMVLLPGHSADQAMIRAEAMRAAIEAISIRYAEKNLPRVTISIGVSVAPEHGLLPQDLMRVADDALYRAKALGRNQVVLASLLSQEEQDAASAEAAPCLQHDHADPSHDHPLAIAAE